MYEATNLREYAKAMEIMAEELVIKMGSGSDQLKAQCAMMTFALNGTIGISRNLAADLEAMHYYLGGNRS